MFTSTNKNQGIIEFNEMAQKIWLENEFDVIHMKIGRKIKDAEHFAEHKLSKKSQLLKLFLL